MRLHQPMPCRTGSNRNPLPELALTLGHMGLNANIATVIERTATRLADWLDPVAYRDGNDAPVAHMVVTGAGRKLAAPFHKLANR